MLDKIEDNSTLPDIIQPLLRKNGDFFDDENLKRFCDSEYATAMERLARELSDIINFLLRDSVHVWQLCRGHVESILPPGLRT